MNSHHRRITQWLLATLLVLCGTMSLTSCSDDDIVVIDDGQDQQDVPLIILDTDIGSSTDDLFSLEMLHRYQDEGRCKLLGVIVNREGEDYAACADVVNTYFGHGDVPIGLVEDGVPNPHIFIDYRQLPQYKTKDGKLMFDTSIDDYSALPKGWELYRRLLAAQPDHSVNICSVGFVACIVHLLESEPDEISPLSGIELVRRKVKCLYLQAGCFSHSDEPDYNFLQGSVFAYDFFALWPKDVDIIFSPMEVGLTVDYDPQQVISDIDWTDRHPIKQVYMNCNCYTGQKMWDPMTVIQAVESNDFFALSMRGTVELSQNCAMLFTPSATGNCRYQIPGSQTWSSQMLEHIRKYNKIRNAGE